RNSPAAGPHRRPQDPYGRVPRMGAGLDRAAGPSRGPRRGTGQAAAGLSTAGADLAAAPPSMVAQVREYVAACYASIRVMVVLCQRRRVGGNRRQLNHDPKIAFGEGRQAGSSGGPGAFSSRISRCATPSVTTKACHGARATLRRLQAVVSKLAYRPGQKFLGTHAVVITAGNTLCALSGCYSGLRTIIT